MKKTNMLVKFGAHQRHCALWLEAHGLAVRDKYDRGVWANASILPQVEAIMRSVRGNKVPRVELWVEINTHNQLTYLDVCKAVIPGFAERYDAASFACPLFKGREAIWADFFEKEGI